MQNTSLNRRRHDDTAAITAEICGVSDNLVRKVLRCERENELIVSVFMELTERKAEMITEVKKMAEEYKA